jgi:hypothetical protein
MKYMSDNFRILDQHVTTVDEAKSFVPDIICVYGAPEKVVSFPQVGYFNIPGPNGTLKPSSPRSIKKATTLAISKNHASP